MYNAIFNIEFSKFTLNTGMFPEDIFSETRSR
eukprot:UN14937